ncbi:MAG: hypothetical protein ACOX8M_13740 [Marvinbryantia sp.]|jgi:hypothetical protein
MKKFLCMLLAFTFCFVSTVPAFAASENQVSNKGEVVVDCDEYKVTAQHLDNQLIVIVEYTDRYEVTTRDYNRNTIVTEVFNYSGKLMDTYNTDVPDPNTPVPFDYYEHTFSNYEYDVDTSQRHESWTCRRENDYKTKARLPGSVTEERLLHWKEKVDLINELEGDILVGAGATVINAIISSVKKGQIGAAIALAGGGIKMGQTIQELYETFGTADVIFDKL